MSDSKSQSLIVTGIALIAISIVLFYYSSTLPKMQTLSTNNSTSIYNEVATVKQYNDNSGHYSTSANVRSNSNDEIQYSYPININTCSIEELMSIDGIGEAKASAIIEYREYLGGYTSVEQIKNIKGIGDKVYSSISPYLCV